MMLLPHVYLLSGFLYGIHQNVYAIDLEEKNELALVDTGLDQIDLDMIRQNLIRWGLSEKRISKVFLTHSHFDHAGNAYRFEQSGSEILIGEQDAAAILEGNAHTLPFAYGRDFPVCQKVTALRDADQIRISERYTLTAIHTPGHTPGSMCYELEGGEEKVLFTGDFIQPGEQYGEVRLGIKVDPAYEYLEYLNSAARLSRSEYDCILAGHYQPVLSRSNLTGTAYRELLVNRTMYL